MTVSKTWDEQAFWQETRLNDQRNARQQRLSRPAQPSATPKPAVQRLAETLLALNSEPEQRLEAATALKQMGVQARPVVKLLGLAGAREGRSNVQSVIVDAIRAAGGPQATDALKEIGKATISADIRKATAEGINVFRREATAARKQQQAHKPPVA